MTSSLYWIVTLSYALALLILLFYDIRYKLSDERMDKSYRFLMLWVIFFCLQDAVWGIAATGSNRDAFFAMSMVYHGFAAMTALVWLNFVLIYLGKEVTHRKFYLFLEGICVLGQVVMEIINVFHPVTFSINADMEYVNEPYSLLAFSLQYLGYIIVGIVALVAMGRNRKNVRRYRAVLCFVGAPLVLFLLVLPFPELPLNSMAYFFGALIIHTFVVSSDREEIQEEQHQEAIDKQIRISNTDEMTGLLNRRAYEEELDAYSGKGIDKDLVYIAMDINGLKNVNDSKGHLAGDEMICAAATIIQETFGDYGKVFRTGGDEFVAILHMNKGKIKLTVVDLKAKMAMWKGKLVKNLSVSVGPVGAYEYPEKNILEIAILADKRMYKDKREYYNSHGIDRRGSR